MQELPPAAPPFVGSLSIPFAELREFKNGDPNQCRYIADEPPGPRYLACGNETLPGESWCGHCRQIVYSRAVVPAERRAERKGALPQRPNSPRWKWAIERGEVRI